jgi:hypothetical protein
MNPETESFNEFIESKLPEAELDQLKAEADAEALKESNRLDFEQEKLARAEYAKYVADLKHRIKSHSKNKLVEIIANQAWQFNHLQQMAKHLHEENNALKAELAAKLGESNA